MFKNFDKKTIFPWANHKGKNFIKLINRVN